jgi:hypothetical protein
MSVIILALPGYHLPPWGGFFYHDINNWDISALTVVFAL